MDTIYDCVACGRSLPRVCAACGDPTASFWVCTTRPTGESFRLANGEEMQFIDNGAFICSRECAVALGPEWKNMEGEELPQRGGAPIPLEHVGSGRMMPYNLAARLPETRAHAALLRTMRGEEKT